MKKILFAATVLCMMGCQNKPTNSTPALDPSNMDTSVAPNESFYQYATGGWQAKNPLKPEHSSYNMFNVLNDNNEIRINELFTQMTKENPAKGTVNQKIADLYKLGLDSVRLNQEGAAPIRAELETILSLDDKKQLTPILSVMQMTSSSPLFSFGPEADLKDSKVNALYIGQSGIGMGDRDYYLDAENESIREAYKTYLNRLFTLAGLEESQVSKATDAVMRIETELAKNMRSNVELRDLQRMYNPMATADLKKNYDAIDWKYLFDFAKINPERVIVCQPEYMEALDKLIETTPIEDLRYYLASQYLNAAAPYLDDNFYAASFDFYGRTMSGKQEPRPRWKRAMAIPNSALGEAVGEMYVEKFFPAEDKARMMTLVENLRTALGQHIDQLDWMSDSTKMRAREKLAAFHVKIGYPDKWKDYSTLEIDPTLSYWENIQRASEWATRDQLAKVVAGVYPIEAEDYENLRASLEKLQLNDASLTFQPESSLALGFGFRCGFLGLLHMEIVQERLDREFDMNVITTVPNVSYMVYDKQGHANEVHNPGGMPDPTLIDHIEEPFIDATIITATDYIGPIMTLCLGKRGELVRQNYVSGNRVEIHYKMPLGEIVIDFYDKLKSISKGYASFDYHQSGFRPSKLVKLDILLNGEPVDALSTLTHVDNAYNLGKRMCEKLKELIPRQQFDIAIQAAIGAKIISRETIKAVRKDVTAKCYGGDVSRKRKLLEKQKRGKKRMKQIGNVEVPQKAFLAVLKLD